MLSGLSPDYKLDNHYNEVIRKEETLFYYAPPGGESIVNCVQRADLFLNTLRKENSELNIVAVCHGGIMNSFRLLLEKIRTTDSDIINEMRTGKEQLLNGHILWYSRMNPYTKEIHDNFKWLYNICPWKENNLEYNINRWKVIDKISFNNDELKEIINKIQPII